MHSSPESLSAGERSRHLDWDGCLNLRDLGGLPTEDGHTTAWGAFVRGDTLCGLSDAGRGSVVGYGIRTVVDLRSHDELSREPNPFAALPDVMSYLHHPLNDPATDAQLSVQASAVERYLTMIVAGGTRIADIFTALAGARPGVLFHCFAGRDRTGIISALLLRLAGVGLETIVRDYEVTDVRLQVRYEEWLKTLEGTGRERFVSSLAERGQPIRAVVTWIDGRYGSVGTYLAEHGTAGPDIDRVTLRLLGTEISGGAGSV